METLQFSLPILPNMKKKSQAMHLVPNNQKTNPKYSPIVISCLSYRPEDHISFFPPSNQNVAAIVFGDGSATQLYPLTKRRSKGAMPIAGNYRLIDAVISNCINSNINKIYTLTQFNSTSLNSHLTKAYCGAGLGKEGLVEVIAAFQSSEHKGWFQGTADAIRKCLWLLEEYPVSEFLILCGHHLYQMDYQKLIEAHRKKRAEITCAVCTPRRDRDPGFGFYKIDNNENYVIETKMSLSVESKGEKDFISDNILSGMGIYIINRDTMKKLLIEYFPEANDLQNEVIPAAMSLGLKVHVYKFNGYWEDMGSIKSFYQANMEIVKKTSMAFNCFYDRGSPLYTLPRSLPPTLMTDAVVTNSIIGGGCILKRCNIRSTVIGPRTRVGAGAVIEDSILMGSDVYPIQDGQGQSKKNGDIPIGIGEFSQIRKAIIDKNARIGENVMIINKDNVQEANREACGYTITAGIVVILKSAILPDGTII
ncbi:inactive glucose-1-phosphate adenylyltransferase small subunit 2, chloroplastic [Impatiens glandulifera]|uniref:inactive glucose-1-phosphate adenylyltransferase small subunit 2, chloroplastic n=1 Tax=Impatiens glandulifera TaxID=253017 RepID=UPI001FB13C44|nr:inactive glucose-1-phosphate adenylyltransferase small subunit 2, chloroplastic [Impatiens glandulifera]